MIRDVFVILLSAALLVLLSYWALWAVNTLFGLAIPYTPETVAAAVVLVTLFSGARVKFK